MTVDDVATAVVDVCRGDVTTTTSKHVKNRQKIIFPNFAQEHFPRIFMVSGGHLEVTLRRNDVKQLSLPFKMDPKLPHNS